MMHKIFKPVFPIAVSVMVSFLSGGVFAQDTVLVKKEAIRHKNQLTVKGRILSSATRNAVYGARLQVKGFSAAITDSLGQFSIKIPDASATLLIEADGFDPVLTPVKYRDHIEILLQTRMQKSYAEQLVMPQGNQYRQHLTANADQQQVEGWQQPMETIDGYLQGRIAGLNAVRRSGMQGVGANLFLNGINSLYATNKPLIIIDGMPYDANDYGESLVANNYTNPLSLIDVKDIDKLTVLKDAASIYGAKGANGAIIITTVKALEQATKIDAGVFAGFNFSPGNLPLLDVSDYRTHLSRMLFSRGMSANEIVALPYMTDDPARADYRRYHNNTDWQRKVLANSMNQNIFLRITGGDNIATYGLTVGYMKNAGIVKHTDLERYNTRFNADFNFSEKLKGYANLSFTYNAQNLKDQGIADKTAPLYNGLVKAPFFNDREMDSAGTESPNLEGVDLLGASNPSALIEQVEAFNKYYRFAGSFRFTYDISKYLRASTMLGIQFDKIRETYFIPSDGVVKDTLWNDIANNRMGSQVKQLFSLFNDSRLEYSRAFNYIHSLGARLGVRVQNNRASQVYVTSANSATDDLVSVQNGLAALRQVGGNTGEWSWMNTYLGADYGFKDKLFLGLNLALDGSSRFGVQAPNGLSIGNRKFPLFPSLSAAWLISSERFMSNSAIDLLKLRASYSVAGNDDIGNYTARYIYTAQNLLGAQGSVRKGISNPALQWETVYKLNGGVDLSFWNNRVALGIDLFSNTTKNLLVYSPLVSMAGFNTVLTNEGELKNNGAEASLNVRIINRRQFKWDLGINAATYKNEITAVPGGTIYTEFAGATILTQTGKPANQFYGYKTNGVYATEAAAAADGFLKPNADGTTTAFKAGDVRFVDITADGVIDERDRTVIGDPNPDFFGGINNRFIWKRFELNALLTFSVGNDVYNYTRFRLESQSGVENQLQSVLNSWKAEGQQTTMPKATWGDPMGNNRFSDRWIEEGSYLRLRALNLSYNVPLKPAAAFKNISVSITGNNLLTFTKYLGFDPEFSVSPSPLAQGIDTGLDPIFKTVIVGVRLGL
jgi:TonB-linked SusC/RagA family outer membrane protein